MCVSYSRPNANSGRHAQTANLAPSLCASSSRQTPTATWREACARAQAAQTQTSTLARSLCASLSRPTQTSTLARSLCATPSRPTHTSTLARILLLEPEPTNSDVNLGSKPVREPQPPISDVESCQVTQIPLIPTPFHQVQHLLRRIQGLRGSIELPRQRPAWHLKTSTLQVCRPVLCLAAHVPVPMELGIIPRCPPANARTVRLVQQCCKIWAGLHATLECQIRDVLDDQL